MICKYIHTYNGTLFSHKKNKILPFVTWMGLEGIVLSYEISQTKKDKHHRISLICRIIKKQKQKTAHRYTEQIGGCQRWGFRMGKKVKGVKR